MQLLKPEGLESRVGSWDSLYDAMHKEYPIEARIGRVTWVDDLPVWVLDLEVGSGHVTSSETGLGDNAVTLMQKFTGQKVFVKVKSIDKKAGVIKCSRREAIADAREKLFGYLEVNQELDAVVKVVTPKELLVEIGGGVLVNIPRAAATQSKVLRLNEIFAPGRQVRVKVTAVSQENDIIAVTMVSGADPWAHAPELRRGDSVAGVVVYADSRMVKVELTSVPGLVGIADPPLRGSLYRGDRISCMVAKFERDKKRLKLRLRGALA